MVRGVFTHSNYVLDFITTAHDPKCSPYRVSRLFSLISKKEKSCSQVWCDCIWALPPFPPHHVVSVPRRSLFFTTPLFPSIILNANQRTNRMSSNEAKSAYLTGSLFCMAVCAIGAPTGQEHLRVPDRGCMNNQLIIVSCERTGLHCKCCSELPTVQDLLIYQALLAMLEWPGDEENHQVSVVIQK